jgi:glycerol dehydrogenase
MRKIFASPARYIQGRGELANIGEHAKKLGSKALVVISANGLKRSGAVIEASMKKEEVAYEIVEFGGESSYEEIDRLREVYKNTGCDLVIGIGGGKIFDAAKASAFFESCPVMICPTIAASDAPCSALAVIYTPDGQFQEYLFLPHNPDMVLLDEEVIAKSPVRLTVSGMGDALATYFEARTAISTNSDNFVGGKAGLVAEAIAELCYHTLIDYGKKAVEAIKAGALTPAVEKVIEANTLMSGLGFESCGCGASHSVHNGLTALEPAHHYYHGEKVAFGVITQLVLEDYDREDIEEVLHFCNEVGLPTTFADLSLENPSREDLMKVAELACAPGETIHNGVIPVTPEIVVDAMLAADALGRFYKE